MIRLLMVTAPETYATSAPSCGPATQKRVPDIDGQITPVTAAAADKANSFTGGLATFAAVMPPAAAYVLAVAQFVLYFRIYAMTWNTRLKRKEELRRDTYSRARGRVLLLAGRITT